MMRVFVGLGATLVAAVVGSSLSELAACSSCGDMGCVQSVTVTPKHPLADPGNYVVDMVADGVTMTCTLTVPSTVPAKCSDSRAYVYQEKANGIEWVSVDGKVKSLSVSIDRGADTIADQTYSVSYQNREQNGPGCGTCPQASETLSLD